MVAPEIDPSLWHKSSRSAANGACVEVAELAAAVAMRDSKDPRGPVLWFDRESWAGFIGAVRDGAFDRSTTG